MEKTTRATQEDVDSFIRAVCPNAPELYKMASSEKTCLNDATTLLLRYRSALQEVQSYAKGTDDFLFNLTNAALKEG